ncbi:MAG: hypothetical protein R6X02_01670 [Enhygromyxa sp.]
MSSAFRFDLRSITGPRLASTTEDQAELAIHEWTTWLRVRSDVTGFVAPAGDPDDDDYTGFVPPIFEEDGLALLLVTRPQGDCEGEAIGLFHGRLEREPLERLRNAVEGTPWSELPRPIGGHNTAPTLELRHERDRLLIERSFNARSGNFLEAIAPLMTVVETTLDRVRKGEAATLRLRVEVEPDEHQPRRRTVRVTLLNRGLGAIALTDPRVPREDRPRLEVRVAELRSPHPDVEPHQWTTLPLPPLPEHAPRSLTIAARRHFCVELPWTAPSPGRYLVRVKWEDYEGPIEPVDGQTPFMPLPERGPSYLGSGPYPLRGANLASRRFEVRDEP